MLGSLGSSVVIHRIGHISMMQMFSFNFGFVQFQELISVPNQSRDSFILFRLDTLSLGDVYVGIIGK